jgi:SAM-dependent methyltransferase
MTVAQEHARLAYDALAPAYDTFTAHHDQPSWTGALLGLAREAGLRGTRLLDVGCGTGGALAPMLDRGFAATGVDISAAMLDVARGKLGNRATLVQGDMRDLPALGTFDLVWALSDVVNYLLDERELVAAFQGFRRNLAPGGVVAFDVDSLATMRALYSSLMVQHRDGEVVLFEGRVAGPLAPGGVGEATVDRLTEGADPPFWERRRGVHRQRHHPPVTIRAALDAAGLACRSLTGVDRQGELSAGFDDLAHSKAVYIARVCAQDQRRR